ncbi:MAG: type II secretion system F family protein [Egibacteraceae bacterium]
MSAPAGGQGLRAADLVGVRAALAAGAGPAAALAEGGDGPLAEPARRAQLSGSVAEAAEDVATGDRGADLLVRALAVAERAGVGGRAAVAQSLRAVRDAGALDRLLAVRTAQARVTATVLSVIPVAAWVLLVGLDGAALGFYATPLGGLLGGLAVALALGGRLWSLRLVRRAAGAAARADPLQPPAPRPEVGRALAAAGPLVATLLALGQPALALPVGLGAAALAARPRPPEGPDTAAGGAAEAVELVAVAVGAGMASAEAVGTVAALAPPAARPPLRRAHARLAAGWPADDAFADGGLAELGRVLAVADRWGAPSVEALHGLAEDLRAERRAAAEEAAERVQVALVFPTTLLTLPAFVTAIVPPLLWTAFAT